MRTFRNRVKPSAFSYAKRMRYSPTGAECLLWERLRLRRLNGFKFRRQAVFFGYIVDFYCPQARLVVEVDGSSHDGREAYDAKRSEKIGTAGVEIIRFTNEQVTSNIEYVLNEINKRLQNSATGKTGDGNPCEPPQRPEDRTDGLPGSKAHCANPV